MTSDVEFQSDGGRGARLAGQVAFITGAANGIGLAIARAFVAEGARVCCADLDADRVAEVARTLDGGGRSALGMHCDVRDADAVRVALDACAERFGRVTSLVCNAATLTPLEPVESLSVAAWQGALDVNLTGAFLVCKFGIPHLRANGGGSVIMTASQMGRVASAGQAAYCSTKGALIQLAKVMALDHANENIRVNTLSPGGTATDRLKQRFGSLEEAERQWGPRHPMGRLGRVEEIARGAVFLASEDASFMTGADLLLDGGYSAW